MHLRLVAYFPLLFPLYLMRGQLLGLPVTLPEMVLGFLFLYFALHERLWQPSWWLKRKQQWRSGLVVPVLLFVLAAFIAVWVAPETAQFVDGTEFAGRTRALGIFKGWVLAPLLYFFMLRTAVLEKPSLIQVALRSLLLGGVFLSFHALYQVFTGDYTTWDGRASGPFESANYLSLYLGPLVVYSVFALLQKGFQRWEYVFLSVSGAFCFAGLYFSQSYAAWLAVAAAIALGLLLRLRKASSKQFWGTFLALLGVGGLLLLSQWGTPKFDQFLDLAERSSSSVRIQVYEISTALIGENPLLGIGLGQYEWQYQTNAVQVLGEAPFEWIMLHPHNIFLAMWLNMGLLGLLAFVWLCVRALGWLLEEDKKERRFAALMLVALLVHGMFDTPYFKNDLAFQFWLLLAVLI